jgi:hypothetical protein
MKRRKPIIDMKEMKKKSKRENINEEKWKLLAESEEAVAS